MKTITNIIILMALTIAAKANDGKYEAAMKGNIAKLYAAKSIEEYQQVINTLDRVGAAEKDKWEPQYYLGLGYVFMATQEGDPTKKDSYLDGAMNAVDKAKKLVPNESEVIALEGFVQMIRLTVDPASRGQQYSQLATQAFVKAVKLDPGNPRALSLLAQMQLGTAQFFGSSTEEACKTNFSALDKFATYKSENPLAPVWGKSMAEEMVKQCEQK